MARYLVQSRTTGRFLVPSTVDGTPTWVAGLREAGGGVVPDYGMAAEMAVDHAEMGELVEVVDLDRLGTESDYDD